MQLISKEYLELNKELHTSNSTYGTSGTKYLDDIVGIARDLNTQDILDYGCGKSWLALNLPFTIKQYDPAIEKYSSMPEPADLVVSTDVLEHIEPFYLDAVLDHLQSLTKKMCFLVVATRPARKTLKDGRNAHLIQKPAKWWMDLLWDRFEVSSLDVNPLEFKTLLYKKQQ